uniref:CCHC-type domain-containing protein n=1 Tax=Arundo donax TaxID=35708 RepID=A0A0A9B7Z1_ARUDO
MREDASSPSHPAFVATRVKEDRECYNCGDTRHLIRDCPKPPKSNRGRRRGNSKGALRDGRGYGGRGGYTANVASTKEELSKSVEASSMEFGEKAIERKD